MKRVVMTEYSERQSDVKGDLGDLDDATARGVGAELNDPADQAQKDASSVTRKVSDAIEDVVAGDSDNDDH